MLNEKRSQCLATLTSSGIEKICHVQHSKAYKNGEKIYALLFTPKKGYSGNDCLQEFIKFISQNGNYELCNNIDEVRYLNNGEERIISMQNNIHP